MKKVIFTAIVLILLGTTWTLYLRWENKRFVESLPKAPSRTNIEQPTDTITQDGTDENKNSEPYPLESVPENNKLPVEENVLQESTSLSEELSPDTAHRPPHPGESHLPDIDYTFRATLEQEVESNAPSSIMDLSVEEIIENNRQMLLKKHGNIPEIDIYLKHMVPVFEGLTEGKSQVNVKRTPEAQLEYSRALATLFPTADNIKQYQEVLQTMEEIKRRAYQ